MIALSVLNIRSCFGIGHLFNSDQRILVPVIHSSDSAKVKMHHDDRNITEGHNTLPMTLMSVVFVQVLLTTKKHLLLQELSTKMNHLQIPGVILYENL